MIIEDWSEGGADIASKPSEAARGKGFSYRFHGIMSL